MDESGEHISQYDHEVYKVRLDPSGKEISKEKSEGNLQKKKSGQMYAEIFIF